MSQVLRLASDCQLTFERYCTNQKGVKLPNGICKDSRKHKQNDLLRSAQRQAKFHASEGEAPSPSDHPAPCHIHFGGNLLTPVRHKPAASIGSILTLSKLHLATLNYSVVNCTSIECLVDPAKVWRGRSTRCQTSSVY